MRSAYRVRVAVRKDGKITAYTLGIPKDFAEALPEGALFVPEFTEDGILYRFVQAPAPSDGLPSWTTSSD